MARGWRKKKKKWRAYVWSCSSLPHLHLCWWDALMNRSVVFTRDDEDDSNKHMATDSASSRLRAVFNAFAEALSPCMLHISLLHSSQLTYSTPTLAIRRVVWEEVSTLTNCWNWWICSIKAGDRDTVRLQYVVGVVAWENLELVQAHRLFTFMGRVTDGPGIFLQ